MTPPAGVPPGTRVAADPIAACAALRGRPGRVLLHSGRDDDGLGSWSFVASDPIATLSGTAGHLIERDAAGRVIAEHAGDPFVALEHFAARHGLDLAAALRNGETSADALPEPRLIGWLGYELGRGLLRDADPRPLDAADALIPQLWFGAYGAIARWRGGGSGSGAVRGDGRGVGDPRGEIVGPDAGAREALASRLVTAVGATPGPAPRIDGELAADPPDAGGAAHVARVERILEYIRAGDVYQVNLARRLTARIDDARAGHHPGSGDRGGDALALYVALDRAAPAPYAGLIEAGDVRVLSGSPECFLSRRAGEARVETRPIKGTRPRGGDALTDARAAAALASDPKDAAEHVMIVDLERNDLGRVARTGSVRVDRLGYVVELPHLYHKVSTVSAELRSDVGLAALLRATFPGGSITGAPKIRAMEIIEELEPARRGPYCGAIGFVGAGGAVELAIAIRIAVLVPGEIRVHVGGGIVADSDPRAELAETEDKAAGWRRALAAIARDAAPR